jgi:hypothetical protein
MHICTRASYLLSLFIMNQNQFVKSWNVLCWNIRGLNAKNKWESLRNKFLESNCDIISIQETKRHNVDLTFIRNF